MPTCLEQEGSGGKACRAMPKLVPTQEQVKGKHREKKLELRWQYGRLDRNPLLRRLLSFDGGLLEPNLGDYWSLIWGTIGA